MFNLGILTVWGVPGPKYPCEGHPENVRLVELSTDVKLTMSAGAILPKIGPQNGNHHDLKWQRRSRKGGKADDWKKKSSCVRRFFFYQLSANGADRNASFGIADTRRAQQMWRICNCSSAGQSRYLQRRLLSERCLRRDGMVWKHFPVRFFKAQTRNLFSDRFGILCKFEISPIMNWMLTVSVFSKS